MRWSIRAQVLIPVLGLLVGVFGLGTWMAYVAAQRAVRQQVETQVRNMANILGEAQFPLTPAVLDQLQGLSGAEFILLELGGRRLATGNIQPGDLPRGIPVAESAADLRLGEPIEIRGQSYLCSGVILHGRSGEGSGALFILYPQSQWQHALSNAVWPVLWVGLSGGILSVLLASVIALRLSRRIRDLQRRTRLIAAGDFSPMPLEGWNDELRDLGQAVNEMAAKLARLEDTVQRNERLRLLGQVGGGLAHQLRNGVTGAKLAVQVYLREHSGETQPEALDVALRQLTLLEAKLRRFLELGQNEPQPRRTCLLDELIEDTFALLAPQCRHNHVTLDWQPAAAAARVSANPGQLGQMLLNVLTNAIEAAAPGGRVSVRLESTGDTCCVEVTDSGAGPPPEVAARLFEPFVTGKPEGTGLGLAVARQIAEAHGGSIDWSRTSEGTCFRITLPLERGEP